MAVIEEKSMKIGDLHFELNLWLNEFKFYKEEIKIFTHRLEEIVRKNTDMEFMQGVEHFQNQYIRQIEVLDELRHEVKQHENIMERDTQNNPEADASALIENQSALREQMDQFKKIYAELRKEFMQFHSRWI